MKLSQVEWKTVGKATFKEFSRDDVPMIAAAMAYHFLFALFPFAIFLAALTEAAHGAARTKRPGRGALARDYRRLVARRGKKKAAVAVGHRILVIAYHVLRDRQEYCEPTPLALDEHRRRRAHDRAIDQLRQLGFEVTLTPKEAAA